MCLVGERSDLLLCPVSLVVSELAGLNLNLIQEIDFPNAFERKIICI